MVATVAELCHERGLNAIQLAEQCDMDQSRVTAIIMGRWTPNPEDRQKIAAVLEVSIDQIRWGHETPIQHLWGHGPT